jgi:hypothetical protein
MGAFSQKTGLQFKSTNAVKAENIRRTLKDLAFADNPELRLLDKKVSDAITTQRAFKRMSAQVDKAIQETQKSGILGKVIGAGTNAFDLLSGRIFSSAIYSVARRAGVPDMQKALYAQKQLLKNIKELQEINKTKDVSRLKNFLKSIGYTTGSQAVNNATSPQEQQKNKQ